VNALTAVLVQPKHLIDSVIHLHAAIRASLGTVAVLRWPRDVRQREQLARSQEPRLLIVDRSEDPPVCQDPLEDWMFAGGERREMIARMASLERASADGTDRPELGDDGILRYRGQWVALSPRDVELLEPMLERFDECIRREELIGEQAPISEEWAFNARLKRLRVRLRSLGLSVTAVRGRGFVLTNGGNGNGSVLDRQP
jgi:hypothetical protein